MACRTDVRCPLHVAGMIQCAGEGQTLWRKISKGEMSEDVVCNPPPPLPTTPHTILRISSSLFAHVPPGIFVGSCQGVLFGFFLEVLHRGLH